MNFIYKNKIRLLFLPVFIVGVVAAAVTLHAPKAKLADNIICSQVGVNVEGYLACICNDECVYNGVDCIEGPLGCAISPGN